MKVRAILLLAALTAMPARVEPSFAQRNLNVAAPPANEQRVADSLQWLDPGTVFKDCDACPEMVVIPADSFTMGSPASEPGRYSDEGPQHQVTISSQFAAGRFEVTFDEWDACVRDSGCDHFPGDSGWVRGRRPVTNVSWDDAKQYAQWLSHKTGGNYRLLTEAEWEYVARAGTTTAFSFGSTITPQQANYHTNGFYADSPTAVSGGQTVPVGSYAPNAFGLYDVNGNVWEWTEDCWNANYDGAPADGSAWVAGNCFLRVLRGGSWSSGPWALRSAFRSLFIASSRSTDYGFRLARTD